MNQTFNNQVMFGHREWSILADNNTPVPVGPNNQPLVDKPLIKEKREREPSEVDKNVEEDSGIVGYMGDDEDIEQAKYNVMSLISDKIGGLDNRLERINQELAVLIGANERDINELRSEFVSEECTPFMNEYCRKEKTIEGCLSCAHYYRNKNELPANCEPATLENICSFDNQYISPSSPNQQVIIGSPSLMRRSIKEGVYSPEDYQCQELGHFDCRQVIKENTAKYQNTKNTICLWDNSEPLERGFNYDPKDNIELKCRSRCDIYTDKGRGTCTSFDTCGWSDEDGICFEKICENRIGERECKAYDEGKNNICGYDRLAENDATDPGVIFAKWQSWFGLKFDKDAAPSTVCIGSDGTITNITTPEQCGISGGRILDKTRSALTDPAFLSNPLPIQGGDSIAWEYGTGNYTEHDYYRNSSPAIKQSITSCRDKTNIELDQTVHNDQIGAPSDPTSFFCTLYDYNNTLSSPYNPCSETGADFLSDNNINNRNAGEWHEEAQNIGCNAKDIEVKDLFYSFADGAGKFAASYCEHNKGDTGGQEKNPNNCYLGIPAEKYMDHKPSTSDKYYKSSPLDNYSFPVTESGTGEEYYSNFKTCNSMGASPDCRLLSSFSGSCNETCTKEYSEPGRCGSKKCEDLDSSLGCNLNLDTDIINKAKNISKTDNWLKKYPDGSDAGHQVATDVDNNFATNHIGYCEKSGDSCIKSQKMVKTLEKLQKYRKNIYLPEGIKDSKFYLRISIPIIGFIQFVISTWLYEYTGHVVNKRFIGIAIAGILIINAIVYALSVSDLPDSPDDTICNTAVVDGNIIGADGDGYNKRIKTCLTEPEGVNFPTFPVKFEVVLTLVIALLLVLFGHPDSIGRRKVAELMGGPADAGGWRWVVTRCFRILPVLSFMGVLIYAAVKFPSDKDLQFIGDHRKYKDPIKDDEMLFGENSDLPPTKIDITKIKPCATYELNKDSPDFKDQYSGLDSGKKIALANFRVKYLAKSDEDADALIFKQSGTSFATWLIFIIFFLVVGGLFWLPIQYHDYWAALTWPRLKMIVLSIVLSMVTGTLALIVAWIRQRLQSFESKYDDYFDPDFSDDVKIDKLFADTHKSDPVGGTCAVVGKFCNKDNNNDNMEANINSAGNITGGRSGGDICLLDGSNSKWSVFLDGLGSSYFDLSSWIYNSSSYKNAIKAQIRINSYREHIEEPNYSLLEDSKVVLGKEYDKTLEYNEMTYFSGWINLILPIIGLVLGLMWLMTHGPAADGGAAGGGAAGGGAAPAGKVIFIIVIIMFISWVLSLLVQGFFILSKDDQYFSTGGIIFLYIFCYVIFIGRGLGVVPASPAELRVFAEGSKTAFFSLPVICLIIFCYYLNLSDLKKKAWFSIATTRYNLYKGNDYDYWVKKCPLEGEKYKCIVKGGDIESNQENSIFEIKLPDKQSERASRYECERFNGCLLSDFNEPTTVETLDQKCPRSGFTGEDISQVKNLLQKQNSNQDPNCTGVVDKFRLYQGLPGTIYDDNNPAFTDGEEQKTNLALGYRDIVKDFPDTSIHNQNHSKWVLVPLFFFGLVCVIMIKLLPDADGAAAVVRQREIWVKSVNIGYPLVFIGMIYLMGVISCAAINNEINKYNNYIEPDTGLTTDLIANTSTIRGSPVTQPHVPINPIKDNIFNTLRKPQWYLFIMLFAAIWIAAIIKFW
jgi:hypothetical protein